MDWGTRARLREAASRRAGTQRVLIAAKIAVTGGVYLRLCMARGSGRELVGRTRDFDLFRPPRDTSSLTARNLHRLQDLNWTLDVMHEPCASNRGVVSACLHLLAMTRPIAIYVLP